MGRAARPCRRRPPDHRSLTNARADGSARLGPASLAAAPGGRLGEAAVPVRIVEGMGGTLSARRPAIYGPPVGTGKDVVTIRRPRQGATPARGGRHRRVRARPCWSERSSSRAGARRARGGRRSERCASSEWRLEASAASRRSTQGRRPSGRFARADRTGAVPRERRPLGVVAPWAGGDEVVQAVVAAVAPRHEVIDLHPRQAGTAVEAVAELQILEAARHPGERDTVGSEAGFLELTRARASDSDDLLSCAALSVHQRVMNGRRRGPRATSASATPGRNSMPRDVLLYRRTDQPRSFSQVHTFDEAECACRCSERRGQQAGEECRGYLVTEIGQEARGADSANARR